MTKQEQTVTGGSLALQAAGNITTGDIVFNNCISRNEVAEIAKAMLAEIIKSASIRPGWLQNTMGGGGMEPSIEMDTIALLRAQLASERFDKESVLNFLNMSSALEQEFRIASSFGSRRIFALGGDVVIAFIQSGGNYERFSGSRSAEFLQRDVPAYLFFLNSQINKICLLSSARQEIDLYLTYRLHPKSLRNLDDIVLAKRARLIKENSDFVALRDLISWAREPSNISIDALHDKVRGTLGDQSRLRIVDNYTIDLAEVIAANQSRPSDGAYVSLVTSSLKLPRLDVSSDLHPRYDRSLSPVQNAYGPAWRHYLEQSDSESDVARLHFVPGACDLARKLLADPLAWRANGAGTRSEEAARLLCSIQELLRIVEPFHSSIIAEIQRERDAIREEVEDLLRDLLSGGKLIEQMLNEYIWLGVELRRADELRAGSEEAGEQENASPQSPSG
jgi:hypothetical protein